MWLNHITSHIILILSYLCSIFSMLHPIHPKIVFILSISLGILFLVRVGLWYFFSITFCFLTSFISYCITQLFNTSNLFWGFVFFVSFFPLLHFWTIYPNFPQCLYNFLSFPSSSVLNLVKAHLSLSMLLMSWLYWSRDIVLCFGQVVVV